MADKGTPGDGPSLEMPSFPFGRRKSRRPVEPESDAPTAADEAAASTSPPAPAEPAAAPPTPQPAPQPTPARPVRATVPVQPAGATQPTRSTAPDRHPAPGPDPEAEDDAGSRRRPQLPSLPRLSGVVAALATGAAMGALGVLLVRVASVGCEAARGTASCGDGPGFLVLVAILAALAYLGGLLLRAFGVPDAGSTSLLAVGVMAVLVLVLFTDALFEWWMALVVPVVTALAYALSWWVTTRVVQHDDGQAPTRL